MTSPQKIDKNPQRPSTTEGKSSLTIECSESHSGRGCDGFEGVDGFRCTCEFLDTAKRRSYEMQVPVDGRANGVRSCLAGECRGDAAHRPYRSEEHTSELQSLRHLVCRLLLE